MYVAEFSKYLNIIGHNGKTAFLIFFCLFIFLSVSKTQLLVFKTLLMSSRQSNVKA